MAEGFTNNAKHLMLDALCRDVDPAATYLSFVSAHTADPTTVGDNEVTGGSPAYARKSITFNAAASGAIDSSNQPVLDIPAATTVAFLGLWSAATLGTYYGRVDIADEIFGAQGTLTVTDMDFTLTDA